MCRADVGIGPWTWFERSSCCALCELRRRLCVGRFGGTKQRDMLAGFPFLLRSFEQGMNCAWSVYGRRGIQWIHSKVRRNSASTDPWFETVFWSVMSGLFAFRVDAALESFATFLQQRIGQWPKKSQLTFLISETSWGILTFGDWLIRLTGIIDLLCRIRCQIWVVLQFDAAACARNLSEGLTFGLRFEANEAVQRQLTTCVAYASKEVDSFWVQIVL